MILFNNSTKYDNINNRANYARVKSLLNEIKKNKNFELQILLGASAILSRFGELGFYVKNGCLGFSPDILNPSEFITETQSFDYYDVKGQKQNIPVSPGSLAFTICQVPIVYKSGAELGIIVEFNDGGTKNLKGKELDYETTQFIFKRLDKVKMIVVNVNK